MEHLRKVLHGREIVEEYRTKTKYFNRERLLTFVPLVVLMLRGHKLALQNALNKTFKEMGKMDRLPTAGAYSQARRKVKAEVFSYLNEVVCADYYRLGGTEAGVKLWHGRRLVGYDGTDLNLPDTAAMRAAYSVQRNQHTSYVQAEAGVLYDLLNHMGLGAALGAVGSEQALLQEKLWERTQAGDVLVLDRNFRDYALYARAVQSGRDVIARCARNGLSAVQAFWASDDVEQEVELTMSQSATSQRQVRAQGLPTTLRVRLLKYILPTGESEVLLTTLLDSTAFPREDIYQVYGWRWRQETYFGRIKSIFEVERFSGKSPEVIQQDFFGVIFLATLESILTHQPQEELRQRDEQRASQTPSLVNRAISYVALVDRAVALLADLQANTQDVLRELHALFLTNPTHHRPGRSTPRKILKHSRRLRYHQYGKRINA